LSHINNICFFTFTKFLEYFTAKEKLEIVPIVERFALTTGQAPNTASPLVGEPQITGFSLCCLRRRKMFELFSAYGSHIKPPFIRQLAERWFFDRIKQ